MTISHDAKKYGILPLKKYSQNFIFDSTLCDKIVRGSGIKAGDLVLEIGPGTAGLTRSILKCDPKLLTVIEIDNRCIQLLEEIKTTFPNLHIIQTDALKFDLNYIDDSEEKFVENSERTSEIKFQKRAIVSNLPYHIGTELMIRWLKQSHLISSMTLMLQKEVVDRIRAKPGTKDYSRLSVICQLICNVEKLFDVSRKAFYPPPKVESSIVKLTPKEPYLEPNLIKIIEDITRFAFMQRRKMVKSSLKQLACGIEGILQELDIDITDRAENLSPEQYLRLAQYLHHNNTNG